MTRQLKQFKYLTIRNLKLYFKDKMTFLISLITPLILLVLFIAFLKKSYEESVLAMLNGLEISTNLLNSFSGAWLFSSVLSTSCVTVAFCSGTMIIDKINKSDIDFLVSPVKKSLIKFSYVFSNLLSTMIVCLILLVIGLIYLAIVGFYMSFTDVILTIINIFISSLFATLLANIIWSFTSSQGIMSGICTLVSALYGFICGAYMPINTMGKTMQVFTSFLPMTYSTTIFRQTFLNGTIEKMKESIPEIIVNNVAKSFDVEYYFFDYKVDISIMFIIIISFCLILLILLILISKLRLKKK